MSINLILKIFILTFLSSNVLAYEGDCNEINKFFESKNTDENHGYDQLLQDCTVNDEGKVTSLNIYTYCLTEDEVNKLISYSTIDTLKLNTNHAYHSSMIENLRSCGDIQVFPSGISKLENLKSLDLFGFSNFKENDIKKIPQSVTELIIGYRKPPQYVIDELSSLKNLKSLSFIDTDLQGLSLTPLESIMKLDTLFLTHNDHSYIHNKKYFDPSILVYFKNLKSLTLDEYIFNKQNIKELSEFNNIEELTINNCGYDEDVTLDDLKNLTKLNTLKLTGEFSYCVDSGTIFGGINCPLTEVSKSIFSM